MVPNVSYKNSSIRVYEAKQIGMGTNISEDLAASILRLVQEDWAAREEANIILRKGLDRLLYRQVTTVEHISGRWGGAGAYLGLGRLGSCLGR